MLTLTTRIGESVVILPNGTPSGEITVVVLGLRRGRVVLGFEAPAEIPIWRDVLAKAKYPELAERNRRLLERVCPHGYRL